MKRKKMLNYLVVLLLVASTFVIGFTTGVEAQGEDGEIYATDQDGGGRTNFLEGSELYFTIELDQDEEVEVTVSFRDSSYSLIENEIVETDGTGSYISSNEGVYFDLTDRRAGEYHLNITSPDGDYDQDTITIHTNYSSGSGIITWNTQEREEERTNFAVERDIYFDGIVQGAYEDEVLEDGQITVQLIDEETGDPYHPELEGTDENGEFEGAFEWGPGPMDPDPPEPGDYSLEVVYFYEELGESQVIASQDIVIYEPEVSDQSTVLTTRGDYETEKNYFMEDEIIYFRADMKDEHGWPIEEAPDIEIRVEKDGEEVDFDLRFLHYEEGSFYGDFELEDYELGDYMLKIMDADEDAEYATSEFTVDVPKYSLEVETNKHVYLPGEEVKAYYTVEDLRDGSQYTDVEVEWRMEYETEDGEDEIKTGEGIDGEFEFTLPEDATVTSEFEITVWANDTEDEFQDRVIERRFVGDLNLEVDVRSDEYFVGQTLYVEIRTNAYIFTGGPQPIHSDYAANVEVDVELLDEDGEEVVQRTVVTDGGGHYILNMDSSGLDPGEYDVVGTAYWNDMEDDDDDDFTLIEESERLSVMLERDKGENPYYPGEEGTVFYAVTHQGETVTEDANVQYRLYSDQRVLDKDFAEGGEIDFTVPDDYSPSSEGLMFMYVHATLDKEADGYATTHIPVSIGEIILNPSQWEYEAEDEIFFEYEFHGIEEDEIDSLEYRILEYPHNELIMSGTPSDGIFEIVIPEKPAWSYRVELEAVTEGGTSIKTVESIYRFSGYDLNIEIVTDSDYTTGVYEPGDEIEIHYELVSRDGTPLPETVRVEYWIEGHPEIYRFRTEETEGTITLTIPELNDGEHILGITVDEAENSEIMEVDSNPWWGNRILFGGASLSGTLMTILIIIALIIACLALYRTRSGKTAPSKTQEMPAEEKEGEEFFIEEGEQEDQWSGVQQEEEMIDEPESDETRIDSEREW